jgi:gluconokinase
LARRLAARHGHFFPKGLLSTQLRILEPPQPDETGVTVIPSDHDPAETVAAILAIVRPGEDADQGESHEAEA